MQQKNLAVEAELNNLKDLVKDMTVETMTDEDVEKVKTATETCTSEFYKVSEKLYQQAQAAGAAEAPNDKSRCCRWRIYREIIYSIA